MCGRYLLDTDIEDLEEIYRIVNRGQLDHVHNGISNHTHHGMVYPTNTVPVIVSPEGQPQVDLMGWGYQVPHVKGPIINARWETLTEKIRGKSHFSEALAHRRCIVPASAYYEWQSVNGDKRPFTIGANPTGSSGESSIDSKLIGNKAQQKLPLLAMAGVYFKALDGSWRFAIVTKPSTDQIAQIHDRMPFLLSSEGIARWLDHRLHQDHFYQWDVMGHDKTIKPFEIPVLTIKEGICDSFGHLLEPLKPEQLQFEF